MAPVYTAPYTGIGVLPRFSAISNPSAGVLVCTFSEPVINNKPLQRTSSYVVTPIGDAKPLFITRVVLDLIADTLSTVTLNFVGGGSVYRLTINGIQDPAGNYIDPAANSQIFELLYPSVDELFDTTDYLFDTNLGAVSMEINDFSQRNVEDLVFQRTRSFGHDEQFRLISEALEDAGINRDETKLKLFKG